MCAYYKMFERKCSVYLRAALIRGFTVRVTLWIMVVPKDLTQVWCYGSKDSASSSNLARRLAYNVLLLPTVHTKKYMDPQFRSTGFTKDKFFRRRIGQ